MQPELTQGCCGKAGAVPLVADEDDALLWACQLRDVVVTGRVQPPLQDVAVNNHGSGQLAVALALLHGADVNQQGSRVKLGG